MNSRIARQERSKPAKLEHRRSRVAQPMPGGRSEAETAPHRFGQFAILSGAEQRAQALLDLAVNGPRIPLPHMALLERQFGEPLNWIDAHAGPDTSQALELLGAIAAARGNHVFFADRRPAVETVTHEVIHAIQSRGHEGGADRSVVAETDQPEREAQQASRIAELGNSWLPRAPVAASEGLSWDAIALLRSNPEQSPAPTIELRPVPSPDAPPSPAPTSSTAVAVSEAPGTSNVGAGETSIDSAGIALPNAPEMSAAPEDVAAREAAVAEAEAIVASAASTQDYLRAYADAPPSVKARRATSLSGDIGRIVEGETEKWQANVPVLDAKLNGDASPPSNALTVEPPPAREVTLADVPVAPAPEPTLAEIPEASPFMANDNVAAGFALLGGVPPEQLADAIGDSLDNVQTSDPSVPRTPGPPPSIPLGGETDPQRIADQSGEAMSQARSERDDAAQRVVGGPGPEQVKPISVEERFPVEVIPAPKVAPVAPPVGPDAYLAMNLPPDVQAAFDEQNQASMQASMAQAAQSADEATATRDLARDEKVANAQAEADELNAKANANQQKIVRAQRTRIQDARRSTLGKQQAEIARVEGEVSGRRESDSSTIHAQVATEQQAIDDRYATGQKEIESEVTKGERQAESERGRAEKEANEQSWWDRAVSFVKDAFNALVSAIGKIFDAVRAAVNTLLDGIKAFALSVIDRVASFVKNAIAKFGEFLKSAINGLIGTFFPELAAWLTSAIDDAVNAAQQAVDEVANTLKAGISALVEGLRKGLNAVINAFEAGLSIAVSIATAALTGDWSGLARNVLESVLKLVGVAPETFYAFIGRADETFQLIIDNPGQFVRNLLDAVKGGIQRFSDNLTQHLQTGVIEWLTGAFGSAGITMPQSFDLLGVLDLARQILGLTWDRMREKANKIVGEQNLERIKFIAGYVTTLVTEGWAALWTKVQDGLGSIRDMVFEGIESFLVTRVVLAAITKLASIFNPVGAIVQLVLTAWNVYQFLRDQLSRIGAIVQAVVEGIGDIARGVLEGGIVRVEGVLARFLPVALDLLAKLLGLGNVSEKVREILEKIRALVDKAIDTLLEKALSLFRGGRATIQASNEPAGESARDPDSALSAEPNVKKLALDEAYMRLTEHEPSSLAAVKGTIESVYSMYKPKGLKSLQFDITDASTLDGRLIASASPPDQRTIAWRAMFPPDDPARLLFMTQPRNETHAAISVDGTRLGEVSKSDKDHHAEQNLVNAYWNEALLRAKQSIAAGNSPRIAVAINRAPCHRTCVPLLIETINKVDPALRRQIHFILAPTGVYEPVSRLTEEAIEANKKELEELARKHGKPATAYAMDHVKFIVDSKDTTTMLDLQKLVSAGWDLSQLLVGKQRPYGKILAEAAHKLADETESAKVGAA